MSSRWKKYISCSWLLIALFALSGCGNSPVAYSLTLEIWGVFDDSDALNQIFVDYRSINPMIRDIKYRKMAPETYQTDILDALASGNGPDIFLIGNTWLPGFQDKIAAAPDTFIDEKKLREQFVDVVADDFLSSDSKVMAVPLSVDSLALYYNKDLFNAAGIPEPPKTWEELLQMIPRLTTLDQYDNITRSAVALGTGDNINRSSDVLLSMMFGRGMDPKKPDYNAEAARLGFDFYTQFSRRSSPAYTWSPRQHYSIDAFYEGTLAMMINYSYHYDTLRQKNAKLNFGVAPLPQLAGAAPINIANYWGYAVAKHKNQAKTLGNSGVQLSPEQYEQARIFESWQLIHYFATAHPNNQITLYNALSQTEKQVTLEKDPTKDYLDSTHRPPARRDLIDAEKNDLRLAPFATGNLIAKSWRPGSNPQAAENLLVETINSVNRGERDVGTALSVFSSRLSQFR